MPTHGYCQPCDFAQEPAKARSRLQLHVHRMEILTQIGMQIGAVADSPVRTDVCWQIRIAVKVRELFLVNSMELVATIARFQLDF
jgi:hypothetical protein